MENLDPNPGTPSNCSAFRFLDSPVQQPAIHWKRRPSLCHPERSRGIRGAPLGPPEFRNNPSTQTELSSRQPALLVNLDPVISHPGADNLSSCFRNNRVDSFDRHLSVLSFPRKRIDAKEKTGAPRSPKRTLDEDDGAKPLQSS